MAQLAHELLRPVEFVPDPVIARLLEMTQGNPLYMVELVQALRASGAIRRHRGSEEWYVAADEIPHAAPGAPAAALAGHAIAALPAHLAALAELCAVVGDDLDAGEIDAVTRSLPTDEASLDPAFGLPRLARFGLLRRSGKGSFAFRHPMVREALEDRIAPARRRQLHRVVLEHLMNAGDRSRSVLERLARHAAGCGESGLAADALIELAEEDRRRHRYVDAETHYSAALDQLTAGDPRREPILAGRGKVRYRLQRFQESLDDLQAARALSEARGDDAVTADLLLEEATILDWSSEWKASADRADRARPLVERTGDRRLAARSLLAQGRTIIRQDRVEDAIGILWEATRQAELSGDHETRLVALLLLGPFLAGRARYDESEQCFAEVIRACQERGDLFHLCVAYNNRLWLWMKRQQVERATEDQRRAISLAHELGFSMLERGSTYNLAELLYWLGKPDEALPLAHRCLSLVERLDITAAEDCLLVARIQCARRDFTDASRRLDWVRRNVAADNLTRLNAAMASLVELQIRAAGDGEVSAEEWEALVDDVADAVVIDEAVEALYIAASWAAHRNQADLARRWVARARQVSGDSPIWKERLLAVSPETTGP